MSFRHHWYLDPNVTFLNHGSFGACPIAVLAEQTRLREQLEREPVLFLGRELESRLDVAREALGALIKADAGDLVFVPNATTAVSTVLRALELREGDELLTTDHVYAACKNALLEVAEPRGAKVVLAEVPFPIHSADQVVSAVRAAITEKTKLILLDHVTSPTGLIFPVEKIAQLAAERGIDVLIDGAHAPGMLELDLRALGVAYYTGNCHKWLCTPKGCAFLYVRKDRQAQTRPLVISHGARTLRTDRPRFRLEHDFTGTQDFTPYLVLPKAIEFMSNLYPGGLAELRAENRKKALEARAIFQRTLNIAPPCPDDMIGSLAAFVLPDSTARPKNPWYADALQEVLFEEEKIEAMIFPFPRSPKRLVRIAAQAYNTAADYQKLADAIAKRLY